MRHQIVTPPAKRLTVDAVRTLAESNMALSLDNNCFKPVSTDPVSHGGSAMGVSSQYIEAYTRSVTPRCGGKGQCWRRFSRAGLEQP